MVVAVVRTVGPPSMMRGSLSPSCSRTPVAEGHSGRPERLAEVAVMGRPRRVATGRGVGASGARGAGVAGLAGARGGGVAAAFDDAGGGGGPDFCARRVKGGAG